MCHPLAGAEGGASEMKYRFYATRDGVPLRLWMMGTNLYSGAAAGVGWWPPSSEWAPAEPPGLPLKKPTVLALRSPLVYRPTLDTLC